MYKSATELKNEYHIDSSFLSQLVSDGVRTNYLGNKRKYNVEDIFNIFKKRQNEVIDVISSNKTYSNVEISKIFRGNEQKGIKITHYYHSLVLLNRKSGRTVDYDDYWEDGVLHYTGSGVLGNQKLERENKILSKANELRFTIYLFEEVELKKFKFIGEVKLIKSPYIQKEPDSENKIRNVYKFPLKLEVKNIINDNQIEDDISLETETEFFVGREGKKVEYYTVKYERNLKLRKQAIKIHGTKCMVCGFDFEKKYGELGKDYIEVHHVKPLFMGDSEQIINPETDLVCLCSNCHRMIHRKKHDVITIDDLIKIIKDYEKDVF